MIKFFICFLKGHVINESTCPYTKRTYQECIRCSAVGVKSE